MLGRVTQRSISMTALNNLQNAQSRTAALQEQVSAKSSLSRGSDDSVRAAAALRLNDQVAQNGEITRNVTDARAWNSTQEQALQAVSNALSRIRDLTVQSGNGALDAKGLSANAAEIDALKATILGAANTQYQGRAVFAGTTDTSTAYADGTWASSDNGAQITRTVAPGVTMTVNINGNSVFGSGSGSLFQELTDLSTALTSGSASAGVATALSKIDARINANATAMATIGARDNQLDHAEDVNSDQLQYLTSQLDDAQGIDLAKTLVDLNMQKVAYQAALQSTAGIIQPTLLDFLR